MPRISKIALAALTAGMVTSCTTHLAGSPTGIATLTAGVGDCLELLEDGSPAPIDCAAPTAIYEVAVALPGGNGECPTTGYARYQHTKGDEFTLCLMLNAKEGDCFDGLYINEEDVADTDALVPAKVECGPDTAVVTKVVPNGTDDGACPTATELPKAYPEPPPGRTVCMDIW